MAGINIPHVETVLLENSDDRLAEVEKAKATGEPFKSVAANPSVVVPLPVAQQILEEASNEDVYVGPNGMTAAAHLEEWHEKSQDNAYVAQTNEEKAKAHAEYSAELVRKQQEENARIEGLIKEGYEPWLAVQQANLERAREHEEKSAAYQGIIDERNANAKDVWTVVDESVKVLEAKDLNSGASIEDQAKALKKVVDVPDVSEDAARAALITKDAIITGAESFEAHAMDFDSLQEKDRPGVAIMYAASSPQALREETVAAQAAAGNLTEEVAKAKPEKLVDDNVAPADEMAENPSE